MKERDLISLIVQTIIIIGCMYMWINLIFLYFKIKLPRFNKLNLTKMKTKYLLQALRFACLPTLSVLMLLFFGFFSMSKTIAFISSEHPAAIGLRICLFIAELVLIYEMYKYYKKEDILANGANSKQSGNKVSSTNHVETLFINGNYRDEYMKYATEDNNIIILERTPKSTS